MLAYADVCGRMLMYADVCERMLTYEAHMHSHLHCWLLKLADVCERMRTYADVCGSYAVALALLASFGHTAVLGVSWPPSALGDVC